MIFHLRKMNVWLAVCWKELAFNAAALGIYYFIYFANSGSGYFTFKNQGVMINVQNPKFLDDLSPPSDKRT